MVILWQQTLFTYGVAQVGQLILVELIFLCIQRNVQPPLACSMQHSCIFQSTQICHPKYALIPGRPCSTITPALVIIFWNAECTDAHSKLTYEGCQIYTVFIRRNLMIGTCEIDGWEHGCYSELGKELLYVDNGNQSLQHRWALWGLYTAVFEVSSSDESRQLGTATEMQPLSWWCWHLVGAFILQKQPLWHTWATS